MGPHEPEPSEPRGFRSIMILIRAATGNKQLIILRIHRSKLLFICSQLSDSSRTSGPAHLETWSRIRLSRPDSNLQSRHQCRRLHTSLRCVYTRSCMSAAYIHSQHDSSCAGSPVRSGPVRLYDGGTRG